MILGESPPSISDLLVNNKKINFRYAEAFLADLYQTANLEIPDNFNPVIEVVKIVCMLKNEPEKIPLILEELKQAKIIT